MATKTRKGQQPKSRTSEGTARSSRKRRKSAFVVMPFNSALDASMPRVLTTTRSMPRPCGSPRRSSLATCDSESARTAVQNRAENLSDGARRSLRPCEHSTPGKGEKGPGIFAPFFPARRQVSELLG
jgi:hypothetical protein